MRAIMRQMPHLTAVYTDEQREAMAVAVVDRRIAPKRVVEMAGAGELRLDGRTLAPFPTNANTVRDLARKHRNRRAGKIVSELSTVPPRDAIEVLRRRLINAADQELAAEEKRPRGKRSIPRLQQIARLMREAAALPGPEDARPVAPGQQKPGKQGKDGGITRGGLAGAILNAAEPSARVETQTAPQLTPHTAGTHGQNTTRPSPGVGDAAQSEQEQGSPGSWASEQITSLA